MEEDLNTTARSLAQTVDEVNNNAKKAQERLERHCSGRDVYNALITNDAYTLPTNF